MENIDFESFAGERVRLTMIDDVEFEGLLWFVRFTDEEETEVHSITLDSYEFEFLVEHIKKIEVIEVNLMN